MKTAIAVHLDADVADDLKRRFPQIEFVNAWQKGALPAAAADCKVLYGGHPSADDIAGAPRLRWVQAFSAGVNHLPLREMQARGIVLTNASGAHGIQISENILAMMLAFAIRLPELVRAQERREWIAGRVAGEKFDVDGQTLLIAGLGGIGSTLAAKASALGMRVVGVRHRPLPPPAGVGEIVTTDRLLEALPRADHVALCLPLTPATTDFLAEPELSAMKPTAYVYNVGRGQSINRDALLHALRERWIAGAGLDVTDPEPLPPDDPLWSFPNVLLSQHTSGHSPNNDRRVTGIFAENLRRYLAGEPLTNVVDYGRGY